MNVSRHFLLSLLYTQEPSLEMGISTFGHLRIPYLIAAMIAAYFILLNWCIGYHLYKRKLYLKI